MATSSSYNFTVTRDSIIKDALSDIGVVDYTETPTAAEFSNAARTLNMIVKAMMSRGMNVWLREEATLFLSSGTQVYSLGPAGDRCTGEVNTLRSSGLTTMRVAGASTDTILEVTSTSGMTAADQIGIILDDGSLYWDVIDTVTDSDTVVVTTGLSGAAAAGNRVFHFTNKIQRPQRIISMMRRSASNIDTPIELISEQQYQNLSIKSSSGKVNQAYYDPRRDTAGLLHLWGVDDETELVFFSYLRPVQDFDASSDNPDFPVEWSRYLVKALAYDLAPKYGIPPQERMLLKADRDEARYDAESGDIEQTSVFFGADLCG